MRNKSKFVIQVSKMNLLINHFREINGMSVNIGKQCEVFK